MIEKKQSRRAVSLLLVLCMVLTPVIFAGAAASAADVNGHWAQTELEKWMANGSLRGDENGSIRPDDSVTRAEAMAIKNRVNNFSTESPNVSKYIDVPQSKWFYSDVARALAAGYIEGTGDTTMYPESTLTREQAMKMSMDIEGLNPMADTSVLNSVQDASTISGWAEGYVATAVANGFICGDQGRVSPLNDMSRAELVTMLDRIMTDTRMFSFPGTYGGTANGTMAIADLRIDSTDVTYQNANITNDVEFTSSIGNGSATLRNATVGGDIIVNGGGPNTINLINVRGGSLEINQPGVRTMISEGTQLTDTTVEANNVTLENATSGANSSYGTITVNEGIEQITLVGPGPWSIVNQSEGLQINNTNATGTLNVTGATYTATNNPTSPIGGGGGSVTPEDPDTTAPYVTDMSPSGAGIETTVDEVVVTFNEDMNTTNGTIEVTALNDGTDPVVGTDISRANNNRTATITISALEDDTDYNVSVVGFEDSAGNVQDEFMGSFTTSDADEPAPSEDSPELSGLTVEYEGTSGEAVQFVPGTTDYNVNVEASTGAFTATFAPNVSGTAVITETALTTTGTIDATMSDGVVTVNSAEAGATFTVTYTVEVGNEQETYSVTATIVEPTTQLQGLVTVTGIEIESTTGSAFTFDSTQTDYTGVDGVTLAAVAGNEVEVRIAYDGEFAGNVTYELSSTELTDITSQDNDGIAFELTGDTVETITLTITVTPEDGNTDNNQVYTIEFQPETVS